MEIANYIIKEAEDIIRSGRKEFPMQIKSAPEFFIANCDDETIQAFAVIIENGVEYKLGTLKKEKVH